MRDELAPEHQARRKHVKGVGAVRHVGVDAVYTQTSRHHRHERVHEIKAALGLGHVVHTTGRSHDLVPHEERTNREVGGLPPERARAHHEGRQAEGVLSGDRMNLAVATRSCGVGRWEIILRELPATLRMQDFDGVVDGQRVLGLDVRVADVPVAHPAAIELEINASDLDVAVTRNCVVAGIGRRTAGRADVPTLVLDE